MNDIVREMWAALAALPESEQISIAESVLEEIQWARTFDTPESHAFLAQLRAEGEQGPIIAMEDYHKYAAKYRRP